MKVWIVRLAGEPVRQWHEATNTWEESWIAACYDSQERAETASVIAASMNPEHLGKIRVAPFDVAASDGWLALARKKRAQ